MPPNTTPEKLIDPFTTKFSTLSQIILLDVPSVAVANTAVENVNGLIAPLPWYISSE